MEALITGGTGLVGHSLVPALLGQGAGVRVLALPGEDTGWLEGAGVTVFRGDVRQPESLTEPMRGADVVFHMAALQGRWVPYREYAAVNVTGTGHVCQAALAAGVRRFVHVSSWTIYGMALGHEVHENESMAPWNDPYWRTKARGELLVRKLVATEGLPAVIVRPGTIFGAGDRLNFGRVAEKVSRGSGLIIGRGGNHLPLVYVSDVAQGLLRASEAKGVEGRAYNITHDEPLTQAEFLAAVASDLGVQPTRRRIPYRLALGLASVAERSVRFTGGDHPVVTRHGVILYGTDNRHSIEKARRELGYAPAVGVREGVRLACAWYQDQARQPGVVSAA
jgi:nucleoside-diphosphate-sugar epimerase